MAGAEELDELGKEVRKIIEANRKFLDRIMDDEFEAEDEAEAAEEQEEDIEEL
ncbi:MAG TPA: hypothetical protein VIU40_04335 [Geobacteraceae bacterium]